MNKGTAAVIAGIVVAGINLTTVLIEHFHKKKTSTETIQDTNSKKKSE